MSARAAGWLTSLLLVSALALGPLREAIAGACVCEIPCDDGCCKWCEIWSPDMISALNRAAEKNISSVGDGVATIVQMIELRIMPTWVSGAGRWMEELTRAVAARRTLSEGGLAVDADLALQQAAGDAAADSVLPAEMMTTFTNSALLREQMAVERGKVASNTTSILSTARPAALEDPAAVVIRRHQPYCTPLDVERGFCTQPATDGMRNADLIAGIAFDPGEGQYDTYADAERDAALAFARNVVSPISGAPLPRALEGSPQAKLHEAMALADDAALSLAAHSFAALIAHRTRRHQK